METPKRRIRSESPSGDPTLLNKLAWSKRWTDRLASVELATTARDAAGKGTGHRSRVQHGLALRTLAWQAKWRGALNEAMGYCISAETYLPEQENVVVRSRVYAILGSLHFARNRFDLANCALDRGFWLLRDTPDAEAEEAMVELLLTRAVLQRHSGERARAGITLGRAQELGTEELMPGVDYCTASWLLADGDAEAARIRATQALENARALSNRLILPYLYGVIGASDIKLGRMEDAQHNLGEGMRVAEQDGDDRVRCFILRQFATLAEESDDLDGARTYLETAARLAKSLGHSFEQKRVALQLADLFEKLKDYKKAVHHHKLAWRLQNETRLS